VGIKYLQLLWSALNAILLTLEKKVIDRESKGTNA
jgi:hypothetical protein